MLIIPKRIAITFHPHKPPARELADDLNAWLKERGVKSFIINDENTNQKHSNIQDVNLLVSMGGDGTLLDAVGRVFRYNIPVIGVNLGKLGFLTELTQDDLYPAMEKILAGRYRIEERAMISSMVYHPDKKKPEAFHALNDIVIGRASPYAISITIESHIDEAYLGTYSADGLIISTATGSTAYSMAANGPIISPALPVMIASPICPHTLSVRPLIISAKETYAVELKKFPREASLTCDGRSGTMLQPGDKISFKLSKYKVKMVRVYSVSFYELLRRKLGWG